MSPGLPIRVALAATLAMQVGTAAAAPPEGCFERAYSERHMREHPGQTVRRIVLRLGPGEGGVQDGFAVQAWLRGRTQVWRAGGPCARNRELWICQPDTDGAPPVSAALRDGRLAFSNPKRLKVVDDRTGPDLDEDRIAGPANAFFLLSRTARATCRP